MKLTIRGRKGEFRVEGKEGVTIQAEDIIIEVDVGYENLRVDLTSLIRCYYHTTEYNAMLKTLNQKGGGE